jgi:hypothetical protein
MTNLVSDHGAPAGEGRSPAEPASGQAGRAPRREAAAAAAFVSLSDGHARRFLIALLAAGAAVLLLVGAFNAVVDPYGTVGTHLFPIKAMTDREIKADLVAKLTRPPEILIFGSSRAWKLDPEFIRRQTGRRAFNASTSGGMTSDAWAFTNLVHDRFPGARLDFLWIFDVTQLAGAKVSPGVRNTASLRRYFSRSDLYGGAADDIGSLFSWSTLATSIGTLRNLEADRAKVEKQRTRWSATGWFIDNAHQTEVDKHPPLPDVRFHIRDKSAVYREYHTLDPLAKRFFEQTLQKFASWGGRGLIVIPPSEPRLITALLPLGYDARYREVLAYLATLQKRYDFTVVDMNSVDKYGGSGRDFLDGVHLRTSGMERMMNKVLRQTGGTVP